MPRRVAGESARRFVDGQIKAIASACQEKNRRGKLSLGSHRYTDLRPRIHVAERDPDAPFPRVVTVAGLKKSGKTTVVEALISGLKARGYRVGSIKCAQDAMRFLDPAGADTRRHAEAGADVVVALLGGETVRYERGLPPESMREIRGFFHPQTDYLVCEGMPDREADQLVVLCLRSMDELDETLAVRGIGISSIAAICGIAASGPRAAPGPDGIPVFDVADPIQRRGLIDRIVGAPAGAAPRIDTRK